jgi:hypothetical protein
MDNRVPTLNLTALKAKSIKDKNNEVVMLKDESGEDFHEEFLSHLENFSESWRKAVEDMERRKY